MKKHSIIFICIVFVVIILTFTIVYMKQKTSGDYANEYTDILGIPPLYSGEDRIKEIRDIDSIEESFIEGGTSQKIVTVKDKFRLFYVPPVGWSSENAEDYHGRFRLVKVEIVGKEYRFGTQKIGIGSSKNEVDDVYRSYYVLDSDRNIFIHFSYDDHDLVNLITISIYG